MKKDNKMVHLLSIFHDVVGTLALATVLSVFYLYLSEILNVRHPVNNPIGVIFIFVTAIIDYISRKKCSNLVLFTIIHALMIPCFIMLPLPLSEKLALGGYTVLIFCFAYRFWTNENTTKTICSTEAPAEILILIVPMYIHSAYFLSGTLTMYILCATVVFLGLHFINIFLNRLLIYILSIPSGSVVPLNKVIRTNLLSIAVVMIVGTVLISSFITLTEEGNEIILLLKQLIPILGFFLTNCVSCMKTGGEEFVEEETTRETHDMVEDVAPYLVGNKWIGMISNILKIIVLIAFFAFLIYLIVQFFREYMHKGTKNTDIIERADAKVFDKKTGTTRTFSILRPRNNNEKIRKIYKKRMSSYNGTVIDIRDTDTPWKINDKIQHKISEDNAELTKLYEQARYGKEILSDKSVSKAKELCKKGS